MYNLNQLYLLSFCIYFIHWGFFFVYLFDANTQIAHLMNMHHDSISKGKVTSAYAFFTKSNA